MNAPKCTLEALPGGMTRLVAELPVAASSSAVDAFMDVDSVAAWWSARLTTDAKPGSEYAAHFPQLEQTMRGEVRAYDPGIRAEFTWSWAHEPNRPTYLVTVTRTSDTAVTLTHGDYAGDDHGRKDAASHQAGWEYFLPRLAGTLGR